MQDKATPRWPRDQRALGAAVRETRARRGLSQERLAALAGTHRNYAGQLERGEVSPTFRTLLRFSDALQIQPSELIAIYERNVGEASAARAITPLARQGEPIARVSSLP